MTARERRKHPRIQFPVPVRVNCESTFVEGTLHDISMSGALLDGPATLFPGSQANLSIDLSCGEIHEVIEAQCYVVREANISPTRKGLAIHFTKLHPKDSLTLFNCIRYQGAVGSDGSNEV